MKIFYAARCPLARAPSPKGGTQFIIYFCSKYPPMLQQGEFYELPVIGISDEPEATFFIVQSEGQEYKVKMYNFQRNDLEQRQRRTLPCHVREGKDGSLFLVQNTAKILSPYYDAEQTYPFIVLRSLQCDSTAYMRYAAQDHLQVPIVVTCPANAEPLRPRQQIEVRVKTINENRLLFLLDNRPSTQSSATLSSLLKLGNPSPAEHRFLTRVLSSHPVWQSMRKQLKTKSHQWPVKAILATPYANYWVVSPDRPKGRLKIKSGISLLNIYRRIALHVIEDAEWLKAFSATESERLRDAIATRVEIAELQSEALELLANQQAEDTIKGVMYKLDQTGYVYNLQHKLSLMMTIFTLRKDLLEKHIDSLLDFIALQGHAWKNRNLPTAFAHFLESYIRSNAGRANRFLGCSSNESRHLVVRMIQAICYLLALTGGETQQKGQLQAMLYYYLSLVAPQRSITNEDSSRQMALLLMDRAFWNLIDPEPFQPSLVWRQDFRQFEILAHRMLDEQPAIATLVPHSYESELVRLSLSREGLTLIPTQTTSTARNILPEGLIEWQGLQLVVEDPSRYRIAAGASLSEWTTWWSDVERSLFSPHQEEVTAPVPVMRKIIPEVGNKVKVRVVRRHPNEQTRFYCIIEDERYCGEGWIDTYVKAQDTGMFFYNPFFTLDSFTFEGRPLLFEVIVAGWADPESEDELLVFNAQPLIVAQMHEWVLDFVEEDKPTNCHLYGYAGQLFRGVTEEGYVVLVEVPDDMECVPGDDVQVRITNAENVRSLRAEAIDFASAPVDMKTVTENFLVDYANGEVYEGDASDASDSSASSDCDNDNLADEEVMMWENNDMHLLLQILDHKAMLEPDHGKAYALLSVAHIVARMLEHKDLVQYFDMRRQLLRQIEHYRLNRQINLEEVERIMQDAQGFIDRYPSLREQTTEILLVGSMGDKTKNDFLWKTLNKKTISPKLTQLASLILSFNLTAGFPLEGQQEDIRRQIKELLHIEVELPQSYSFGIEGQQLEFKTSTVFPPDNDMRPNIEVQTYNLMKVVCGMLNAQGGTLMLGVNDVGVACGLKEDLNYFKGDVDRLKRHVRDSIFRSFGVAINDRVRDEQVPAGKHLVLAFHIPACHEPVALDNAYFVRQGSSTRYISSAEMVRNIMAARNGNDLNNSESIVDWQQGNEQTLEAAPTMLSSLGNTQQSETTTAEVVTSVASTTTEEVISAAETTSTKLSNASTTPLDTLSRIKAAHTSLIRSNVVNSWEDNYGVDTVAYLRFYDNGEWCVMDEENWEDSWLTLAVHDREEKGALLMIYEDGTINRVPMELCLEKVRNKHFKRYHDRTPLFFCPVATEDALLTAYEDDHGHRFFRLDNVENIVEGKMLSAGNKLVRPYFEKFVFCEVIPADKLAGLEKLRNLKDSTLGHSLEIHYEQERKLLAKLGIQL